MPTGSGCNRCSHPNHPRGVGRRSILVASGMASDGASAPGCPSARRRSRWQKAGVYRRRWATLPQQADGAGHLAGTSHCVDRTIRRAHQPAAGAKQGPRRSQREAAVRAASAPKSPGGPRATASPSPCSCARGRAMRPSSLRPGGRPGPSSARASGAPHGGRAGSWATSAIVVGRSGRLGGAMGFGARCRVSAAPGAPAPVSAPCPGGAITSSGG